MTDFIETLFGFKVDPARVLREQATRIVCGGPGFHTHTDPSVAPAQPPPKGSR